MRRILGSLTAGTFLGAVIVSCNGTTGDTLLAFPAYARGAPGAAEPFVAGGFTIQLTAATMYIGAVYFDESPPGTGFDGPVCIASGIYAAQVPGPLPCHGAGCMPPGPDVPGGPVDLLSSAPQEFEVTGNGTADTALSWDVWLTDSDVNEVNFTPIVQLEGTATNAGGDVVSFGAVVTINASNRLPSSSNPAEPGLDPLCTQRIIQIALNQGLTFFPGGALYITIDPRVWFDQQSTFIDFSPGQLPLITDPNCNPDFSVPYGPENYALPPETPPPASQTCGGSGQACCAAVDGGALPAGVGDSGCLDALTCTSGLCGPTYCIPNSSLLAGTVPGAQDGVDLFAEIHSGAPFSVSYTKQPP